MMSKNTRIKIITINIQRLSIMLTTAIFCSMFSGCYDKREVDDLTYAIAIGFDKGQVNPLRLTVQYAIPIAIGSSVGGGGGGSGGGGGGDTSRSVGIVTIETNSIYSGLNMINNFIGKQMNMSHAKVAVFSKDIAQSGKMHDYIHAMVRGREFRPDLSIAVSRDSAEAYIASIKPVQEADPAKYYELKYSTYTYTGLTANSRLSRFYSCQESYTTQSVATLVGVGKYKSSKDIDPQKSTYQKKGREKPLVGDYLAGDIPKIGDVKGETLGLAAFDGTKMAGELDGEQATMYLMASGEFNHTFFTFPDPEKKESYVILNLRQSRHPQYKIELSGTKPEIHLVVKLEGDYLSIQSGIGYEESPKLEKFESSAEEFIKTELLNFLNYTAKDLHTDICGFGRYAKSKFLTWDDWTNYKWLSIYRNSSFDVSVDLKIRRTGLMIRSMPAISSHGLEK